MSQPILLQSWSVPFETFWSSRCWIVIICFRTPCGVHQAFGLHVVEAFVDIIMFVLIGTSSVCSFGGKAVQLLLCERFALGSFDNCGDTTINSFRLVAQVVI